MCFLKHVISVRCRGGIFLVNDNGYIEGEFLCSIITMNCKVFLRNIKKSLYLNKFVPDAYRPLIWLKDNRMERIKFHGRENGGGFYPCSGRKFSIRVWLFPRPLKKLPMKVSSSCGRPSNGRKFSIHRRLFREIQKGLFKPSNGWKFSIHTRVFKRGLKKACMKINSSRMWPSNGWKFSIHGLLFKVAKIRGLFKPYNGRKFSIHGQLYGTHQI